MSEGAGPCRRGWGVREVQRSWGRPFARPRRGGDWRGGARCCGVTESIWLEKTLEIAECVL